MARNAHEATRFTATQPHAHSKVPGVATTIPLSKPGPPGETPSQKVARLREAARRAKLEKESRWDKIVLRGRVWADRAHKVTATGLILASLIATGFAALSFSEMIMANRGKKAEWYKQQELAYARALEIAKKAEKDGTLTSDLALFLNKERAVEQAEEEKRHAGTFWQRTRSSVFGGMKMEEGTEVAETVASLETSQATNVNTVKEPRRGRPADVTRLLEASPVPRIAAEDSRVVESRQTRVGGPLDRLGQNTATFISSSSKGWINWVRGQ